MLLFILTHHLGGLNKGPKSPCFLRLFLPRADLRPYPQFQRFVKKKAGRPCTNRRGLL